MCPFCLSHWVCAIAVLLWFVPVPGIPQGVFRFIVLVMAATRMANLTNDLTHTWSRSPVREELEEDETEAVDVTVDDAPHKS